MTTVSSHAASTLELDSPKTDAPAPLRAVHTSSFPALLRQLGASLLVTTYQAGKLVLVRDEGDHLNTHFRTFQAPMGMALAGDRLAVGTMIELLANSFVVPDAALADVAEALRAPVETPPRTSPAPAHGSAPRELFVKA